MAFELANTLESYSIKSFLSERDIEPGQIEALRIEAEIQKADAALLLLSDASITNHCAMQEYAAIMKEASVRGFVIIPVIHGNSSFDIPPLAGTRLWVDLSSERTAGRIAKIREVARLVLNSELEKDPEVGAEEAIRAARGTVAESGSTPSQPMFVVTYASSDKDYGQRLVAWMRKNELPSWSIADLRFGDRFISEIRTRIRKALAVVVVMSPASEESEDVEREVLEAQRWSRALFPVLLHGEPNFLLASSWYFDARGGNLPGDSELIDLRRLHNGVSPAIHGREIRLLNRVHRGSRKSESKTLYRLAEHLRAGEVTHADLLTTNLVLEAAGRLEAGWLEHRSGQLVPFSLIEDLSHVWEAEFGGIYGFRTQVKRYRLVSESGNDWLSLAEAYGWREAGGKASSRYDQFARGGGAAVGFFPTLRNPQAEFYNSWYDRWRRTALQVHLRLREWQERWPER